MLMLMQSDQPASPDYNFIMNNTPGKRSLFSGGSKNQRLLIMVAGAGVLVVVFGLLFALIFGQDSSNTEKLVGLAARQTEIIRIAEIGEKQATSTDTKNYASTVKLSMTSANNQLVDLLKDYGRKVQSKDLIVAKDITTDAALTAATQANRFDTVFTETIDKSVEEYQAELLQAYNAASSKKQRKALEAIYNQTKTFVKRAD